MAFLGKNAHFLKIVLAKRGKLGYIIDVNFASTAFLLIMKAMFARFGVRALSFGAVAMVSMSNLFAKEAAQTGGGDKTMLDKWIIDGGWTMIPLVILLGFAIFLAVYCLMSINKNKFCPDDLRGQLIALMGECRVRSAIELATTSPTYLGRLVAYALPNIDATRPEDLGKDAIEDAIADFANNERAKIMFPVDILALVGSLGPSIGLFGTIQGMVGAFGVLASSGQADPSQLAGDISVALLTTFWGLIVSIVSIPAFFFIKKHAQKLESESVNAVSEMVNTSINVINAEAQLARIPEGLGAEEGYEEGYATEQDQDWESAPQA